MEKMWRYFTSRARRAKVGVSIPANAVPKLITDGAESSAEFALKNLLFLFLLRRPCPQSSSAHPVATSSSPYPPRPTFIPPPPPCPWRPASSGPSMARGAPPGGSPFPWPGDGGPEGAELRGCLTATTAMAQRWRQRWRSECDNDGNGFGDHDNVDDAIVVAINVGIEGGDRNSGERRHGHGGLDD
eukprot:3478789-Pyramimonas_sp.AAC.2